MPTPDPYQEFPRDFCSPLQKAIFQRNWFQDELDRRKARIEDELIRRAEEADATKKHRSIPNPNPSKSE